MIRLARSLVLAFSMPIVCQAAERPTTKALIAAGQAATLEQIDPASKDCGDERRVDTWLRSVVGNAAKSVTWSGGRCRLTNPNNPIDSGAGWCARADIVPRRRGDKATIEIYFETPKAGVPGEAFAFRAVVHTKDGWDYMRETSAFAANWRETFAPDLPALPAPNGCK